jgi:hypothetical protein
MLSDLLKVSISSLSWGTWEVVMQDGSWGFVVLAAPLIYMVLVAYLPAGTLMLSGMLLMYAGLGIVVFGAAAGGIGVAMTAPLGIALVVGSFWLGWEVACRPSCAISPRATKWLTTPTSQPPISGF